MVVSIFFFCRVKSGKHVTSRTYKTNFPEIQVPQTLSGEGNKREIKKFSAFNIKLSGDLLSQVHYRVDGVRNPRLAALLYCFICFSLRLLVSH